MSKSLTLLNAFAVFLCSDLYLVSLQGWVNVFQVGSALGDLAKSSVLGNIVRGDVVTL